MIEPFFFYAGGFSKIRLQFCLDFLQLVEKSGVPRAGFSARSSHWLEAFLDGVEFGRLYKVPAALLFASLLTCRHVCIVQTGLEVCVMECCCRGSGASVLDGLYLFVL